MKNLIVSFTLALVTGLTPVIASGTGSEPESEKTFAKHFTGAEDVKWTRLEGDFQRVSFTLGGTRAEAYFNSDGVLLGTARNLFYSQLPLVVLQTVSNRFSEPVVIEVKEIINNEGTSYRLVLEQKDKKFKMRLDSLGEITEVTKLKN